MKNIIIYIVLALVTIQAAQALTTSAAYPDMTTSKIINPGESQDYYAWATLDQFFISAQATANIYDITTDDWQLLDTLFVENINSVHWYPSAYTLSPQDYGNRPGNYLVDIRVDEQVPGTEIPISDSAQLYLQVSGNRLPHAEFSYSPSNPNSDATITFTSTSYDEDGTIESEEWYLNNIYLGEGTVISIQDLPAGVYTAKLLVTDNDGGQDIATQTLTVTQGNTGPQAAFSWDPQQPLAGETVQFNDESIDDQGIVSWHWYFDDQGSSNEQNPSVVFDQAGNYDVTLLVYDAYGLSDSVTHTIHVIDTDFSDISFTANPQAGDAPLVVDFSCQATGGNQPVSYIIIFGDGGHANSNTATHTYTSVGQRQAQCIATDATGDTIDESLTITITEPNHAPQAAFSWSPQQPISGTNVHFIDQSSDDHGIVSWHWNFGDGSTSNAQEPIHEYSSADNYVVTLTVEDAQGLSDTEQHIIIVTNDEPEVTLTASPLTGDAPLNVQFECSVNGGDLPNIYHINFGDGESSQQASVTHTYQDAGVYAASCEVTDVNGDSDSDGVTITVDEANRAPVMEAVPDQEIMERDYLQVQLEVSDPDNDPLECFDAIYNHEKYLPDWLTLDSQNCLLYGTAPDVNDEQTYQIYVGVRDPEGLEDTEWFDITVLDHGPSASFTYEPSNPLAHDTVTFTSTSTDDGYLTAWNWEFSDGESLSGPVVSRSFDQGVYTATLTVTDNGGLDDSISQTIVVGAALISPTVDFSYSPTLPRINEDVIFVADAEDDDGTIVQYQWDMGDGTILYGEQVNHSYLDGQEYAVELVVTDNDDLTATKERSIIVRDYYPLTQLEVAADPSEGVTPLTVNFACSVQGGEEPITYSWDFGDGETSTLQNPVHIYQVGNYQATCTVTDDVGQSLSGSVDITVYEDNHAPVMQPIEDQDVDENTLFNFAYQVSDPDGDVLECYEVLALPSWLELDEQDCSLSGTAPNVDQDQDPIIIHVGVRDPSGLNDSEYFELTVRNVPVGPQAAFSWEPQSPMINEQVQFTDQSSDDIAVLSWHWNFGDGFTSAVQNPQHSYAYADTFMVSLTVTDAEGLTNTVQQELTVQNMGFVSIDLSADPQVGVAPLWVEFTCEVEGGDAPIRFDWDFGDNIEADELMICDHNGDGVRNLVDVALLAQCKDTFDANNDGIHNLVDIALYAQNHADNAWCASAVSECNGAWDDESTAYHLYNEAGIYQAQCTAYDINGDSISDTVTVTVTNDGFDGMDFSADPQNGDAPLDVDFACEALGGDAPVTYTIDFGDGSASHEQIISHTYQTAGVYTATCTANDHNGDGIEQSIIINAYEPNQAPIADFSWTPEEPEEGDDVTFDASVSEDLDGTIVSYLWDFNQDGIFEANGITQVKNYPLPGSYPVTLKVIDNDGADAQVTKTLIVGDVPELIIDEFNCNPDVVVGHIERCSIHVTDSQDREIEGADVRINYLEGGADFGTCVTNFKGYCSVDRVIELEPDVYTVEAYADKEGFEGAGPAQDNFRVWTHRYDIVDLDVYADDSFSTPEDTFYRGEDMYAQFAIYDTIEEQYVCDDELVRQVFLRVNNAQPLNFTELEKISNLNWLDQVKGTFGGKCSYQYMLDMIPLSDDYLGEGRVFSFVFNFSDNSAGQDSVLVNVLNNPVIVELEDSYTIHKETPEHQGQVTIDFKDYVSDVETAPEDMLYKLQIAPYIEQEALWFEDLGQGVFTIYAAENFVQNTTLTLTVDDTDGSEASDTAQLLIDIAFYPQAPVADAGDDRQVTEEQTITFDGSASYDPDGGDIVHHSWDFGNGQSATGAQVSTQYDDAGTYTVTLTVTDDEGDTDTDTAIVTVLDKPYVAACSDGIDNDHDGLIDMDDPGCESPLDTSEYNFGRGGAEKGLKIVSISTYTDQGYEKAVPGDIVLVELVLENVGDETLEDLRASFAVPEMGIKAKSSQFDLREGARKTKTIQIYLPYDAYPGDYYTEIGVANDDLRRSTHRMLEVVDN